ncbi:MAG: cytochrome c oxidase subunit II [Singulisphaera sp.]|nr:cytochrome c oxidase subunit II [Singulisphaera sp.]
MWDFPLFPEQASKVAGHVDAVAFYALGIVLFFTTLICILILFFAIKYRRGSKANRENAVTQNHTIEALWIGIPLALAMILFTVAMLVFFEMYRPPEGTSEVYVLGRQWMWETTHPENGKREINELHWPVDRPVRLTMTSEDVIHSFFIPAFRIKQDVVPGRYTSMWFQPNKIGKYHLFCAEYCGTKHSGMIGWIHVMDPADYQRWLESGTTGVSLAAEGAQLFRSLGCSGCHGLNASVRAPLLDGVYGHPVPLETGEFITADERYIRDSILRPSSQVVAGYKPVMPTFEGRIREDELLKVIAYIKSLSKNEGVVR